MFNTNINDNSKNTGFFNNNLKNEVNITTKKGLFKTKVTVSSSKEIKRKKENDRMLDLNKTYKGVFISISNKKRNKKKPSLFNKKKEGISMNKNLVKVLVAGVAVVGAVAGAVVVAKKVKARKAEKAEEVKDENINEEVEEVEEEVTEEEVSENEEVEEDETDDEDDDDVPVVVEKVVVRIAHYVGIGIGILLGRLLLKDTIRLEEATKCL